MNRRSFLKLLASSAGLAVVPELPPLNAAPLNPIEWIIEKWNYDTTIGVMAQWLHPSGVMVRQAVKFPSGDPLSNEKSIVDAKRILMAWYRDVGLKKSWI